MAWAEINGIRMFYESHGEGDAIVFAHGAGGNHLSWYQQVPLFSKKYRCVTFDHRGFGRTADVAEGPGANAYPDDLRALMDHLGIEKAVLVAQSMGGSSCMGFTVAWPERVRGLVMADTTGAMVDDGITSLRDAHNARQPQPMTLVGRAYNPTLKDRDPAKAFLYDSVMALNPARPAPVGERDPRFNATTEKLAALKLPVQFLVGENDAIVPVEVIKHAATLIPGARFAQVPVSGHSVYFEEPEAFNRIVGEFLASVG